VSTRERRKERGKKEKKEGNVPLQGEPVASNVRPKGTRKNAPLGKEKKRTLLLF